MPYKSIEARREANRRWRAKAVKAGYWRDYTEQNKERVKEQKARSRRKDRAKSNARARVSYRVNNQHAWPPAVVFKCSDCNAQAEHYHHEDYSQWWNVEPLCTRCHGIRHRISTPVQPLNDQLQLAKA